MLRYKPASEDPACALESAAPFQASCWHRSWSAPSALIAVRSLFIQHVLGTSEVEKREFVFLSQLQAQPTISWVAFGSPDRSFFAAHKLGHTAIEMLDIAGGETRLRIDRYGFAGYDVVLKGRRFQDSTYSVTDQQWYREASQSNEAHWFTLTTHPDGERPAVGLAGPGDVDHKRAGVLAIIIELTRVSNFLSQ